MALKKYNVEVYQGEQLKHSKIAHSFSSQLLRRKMNLDFPKCEIVIKEIIEPKKIFTRMGQEK